MKDVLIITPPFTQLNTPYPASAYLKGFLNTLKIESTQMDLGIEVILKLFCNKGLSDVFDSVERKKDSFSRNAIRILALRNEYEKTIDHVILFLQGKNQTLARQIITENFLPEASRFAQLDELDWAFGSMGNQDRAKHLATLYLEDLSDFIVECVDSHFGFSRYAERLGRSANSFDDLYENLQNPSTYIDKITLDILSKKIDTTQPKLVCFSVPFPGNLYSSLRCAAFIKENYPETKVAMGGGFPNTELRQITDPRVFDFFDFITLDDGELPIELLISSISNNDKNPNFKRTFLKEDEKVIFKNTSTRIDYKQSAVGTPDYSDLLLDSYISVIEVANPMHSLWSDGRWNKLTMAHGCYWKKCTFCDISLDYIRLYEPIAAKTLVDRMEQMIAQTGERGFHFVDEAAPPALMREVALEILRRKLTVTWWTNIRFEKNFTKDLCVLLKASGCIAVSGGLEVASDRLLKLIDKGVTVKQVAQVTHYFTDAGIMVHAYLMYGYPSQTIQETIDSLEMVRQMFELGIIQSGFWHQFALTAHSPVGLDPESFGVIPDVKPISFAHNDIVFEDKTGINHEAFSFGLKKSLFNFMHGLCYDFPLSEWFDFKIPRTTIKRNYIAECLYSQDNKHVKPNSKVVWLGANPIVNEVLKSKQRKTQKKLQLTFHDKKSEVAMTLDYDKGKWLTEMLNRTSCSCPNQINLQQLQSDYEDKFDDFDNFWNSKQIGELREVGLVLV